MPTKVSFFVRGKNPYESLKKTVVQSGILKNARGLRRYKNTETHLSSNLYLYQLSQAHLRELQLQQGLPFQGFSGEAAQPFNPRPILLVSKDRGQKSAPQTRAHLEALDLVQNVLRRLGIGYDTAFLKDLTAETFLRGNALVIALGGDGTFIGTSHFIQSAIPIVGVISNPQTATSNGDGSWGNFMLLPPEKLEYALNLMYHGKFELASLNRLAATITDGRQTIKTVLALNDISIGEQNWNRASRYSLRVNGIEEGMVDNGVLAFTGSCSTVNSRGFNSGGLTFDRRLPLVQFTTLFSRSYFKDGSEPLLRHGLAEELEVVSALRHQGVVSIDSAAEYAFPAGARVSISSSDKPLNLAVFPSIATRAMTGLPAV